MVMMTYDGYSDIHKSECMTELARRWFARLKLICSTMMVGYDDDDNLYHDYYDNDVDNWKVDFGSVS